MVVVDILLFAAVVLLGIVLVFGPVLLLIGLKDREILRYILRPAHTKPRHPRSSLSLMTPLARSALATQLSALRNT